MNTSFSFAALLLGLMLIFASCDKEALVVEQEDALLILTDQDSDAVVDELVFSEPTERTQAKQVFANEPKHRFHGDCFSLLFPYDIELPDGSTATVSDTGELRSIIRDWATNNPDRLNPRVRPMLVYPLSIQLADGSIENVDSRRALVAFVKACRPAATRCAEVQFPIELNLGDNIIAVDNASQLRLAIRRYLAANPDGTRPAIVFPISVALSNGDIEEVNALEELRRLRFACINANAQDNCIQFEYPLTATTDSGRTVTINNYVQLRRLFSRARVVLNTGLSLDFPLNVTYDGSIQTLQSIDELNQLRRACAGIENEDPCFELQFPILAENLRGASIELDSRRAFERALFNSRFFSIQWPVVATKSDGGTVSLSSKLEYAHLVASCR